METHRRMEIEEKQLWADYQPGRLILTVNRRLAMGLRDHYNREQARAGHMAWESLYTMSWGDWINDIFQHLADLGLARHTLLMPHQNHLLWEQIIRTSESGNSILYPANTAHMAMEAWELMQAWEIEEGYLRTFANEESAQFLDWTKSYRERCTREKWIDSSLLPGIIARKLESDDLDIPDEITLAGFEEITPQQERILALLERKGCKVQTLIATDRSINASRVELTDQNQELEVASIWALEKLQENPESTIGIVVPQLHKIRSMVENVFRRCFHPESILPGHGRTNVVYNISVGIPLSKCPLVVDAFSILHLAGGSIGAGELSRLLRSPILAAQGDDRSQNAMLDAHLRKYSGERNISLDTVIRHLYRLRGNDKTTCTTLLQRLESLRKELDHLKQWQSPHKWIDDFNRLFNVMGWPNSSSLNSIEYQQVECFNQLMSSFQMLGKIVPELNLPQALERLHGMATESMFQPKTESAPIQITGLLEAAGLAFDHLWITGLTDDQWPSLSNPNPLLPVSLQRRLNMPHSSPQREMEYARSLTRRLLISADEVIISHATTDGTKELRPSPLISTFDLIPTCLPELRPDQGISSLGYGQVKPERLVDQMGPEIELGSYQSGGSWLLADQSACPFRAFALHRLAASPLEDPASGMDARSRGSIIHRILEKVWSELGSLENLLHRSRPELLEIISAAVSQELDRIKPLKPATLSPGFITIEKNRVTNLIMDWLELEKQRAPFTIQDLEKRGRIALGGLKLDIVTDRVDVLGDGTAVIIDYKTGKLKTQGWFDERIGEPQLPLYASTNKSDVAGVFLAGISRENMKFLGVTDREEIMPGVRAWKPRKNSLETNWEELKAAWKRRLELLAEEVQQGVAKVDPQDPNIDCRYCPLPSLCRIHEQAEWDEREEQE